MFIIDYTTRVPIYEQIKSQLLSLISSGALREGDKLPSIRTLAADTRLNVNTIKKVFAQLESDGVIVSVVGSGSFVAEGAYRNPRVMERASAELLEGLKRARSAGLGEDEILEMVKKLYREEKP